MKKMLVFAAALAVGIAFAEDVRSDSEVDVGGKEKTSCCCHAKVGKKSAKNVTNAVTRAVRPLKSVSANADGGMEKVPQRYTLYKKSGKPFIQKKLTQKKLETGISKEEVESHMNKLRDSLKEKLKKRKEIREAARKAAEVIHEVIEVADGINFNPNDEYHKKEGK